MVIIWPATSYTNWAYKLKWEVRRVVLVASRLGRFLRGWQTFCLKSTLTTFVKGDSVDANDGLPKDSDLASIDHFFFIDLLRTLRGCTISSRENRA